MPSRTLFYALTLLSIVPIGSAQDYDIDEDKGLNVSDAAGVNLLSGELSIPLPALSIGGSASRMVYQDRTANLEPNPGSIGLQNRVKPFAGNRNSLRVAMSPGGGPVGFGESKTCANATFENASPNPYRYRSRRALVGFQTYEFCENANGDLLPTFPNGTQLNEDN
ncbi:MAG: hypothetical protein AAFW60_07950, partial [Pseudomonadota bacterium]